MAHSEEADEHAADVNHLGVRSWSTTDERATSLMTLYNDVVSKAEFYIDWYAKATRPNKRYAQALRGLSIILISLAALIPLYSQIRQDEEWSIEPAWASIVLGVAVALIALDKFFGFSSAWARFTVARFQLEFQLNSFQLEWQSLLNGIGAQDSPTANDAQDLIDTLRRFVATIGSIVQSETSAWVTEFNNALAAIEASTEANPS